MGFCFVGDFRKLLYCDCIYERAHQGLSKGIAEVWLDCHCRSEQF